ncbi:MAG: hypothetical protein AMXMBFR47_44690 [Planctomycetota bacterium]
MILFNLREDSVHDPAPDDLDLIRRLRAGDAAAAGLLADRYRAALVRFARSMIASDAAAEDVAQETLARLSRESLPEGPPRPWLYRIARNLCLDLLRRRKASPTCGGQLETGLDRARTTAGPLTRVAAIERSDAVRRALDALPEEYRAVLILRHVENLAREEIAAVLGISAAAVKGRLVRGSELLRETLRSITGTFR